MLAWVSQVYLLALVRQIYLIDINLNVKCKSNANQMKQNIVVQILSIGVGK